jgi:hypothetical protein
VDGTRVPVTSTGYLDSQCELYQIYFYFPRHLHRHEAPCVKLKEKITASGVNIDAAILA